MGNKFAKELDMFLATNQQIILFSIFVYIILPAAYFPNFFLNKLIASSMLAVSVSFCFVEFW